MESILKNEFILGNRFIKECMVIEMKKYFIGINWEDEFKPILHLKDYNTNIDEYFEIPNEFRMRKNPRKVCIGTINPYTKEYISCNHHVSEKQTQCNNCQYMYDFYNCVRCHGSTCCAKNEDVLKYCGTPHYVYLAYFGDDKIKVGTASEIKKYERLLEQGALFSMFIAKTPTGKIARIIEKGIIDFGISGMVTTNYKMKNILSLNHSSEMILKILFSRYKEILNAIPNEYIKYLIEPEINSFSSIKSKIEKALLSEDFQLNMFSSSLYQVRKYDIKRNFDLIFGRYLFVVGNILAVENNGMVELINLKKIEGYLFEFENMSLKSVIKKRRQVK